MIFAANAAILRVMVCSGIYSTFESACGIADGVCEMAVHSRNNHFAGEIATCVDAASWYAGTA
jgi:hypothetical protein